MWSVNWEKGAEGRGWWREGIAGWARGRRKGGTRGGARCAVDLNGVVRDGGVGERGGIVDRIWRLGIVGWLASGWTRLRGRGSDAEGGGEVGRITGCGGGEGVGRGQVGEGGLWVHGQVRGWRACVHDGFAVIVVGSASTLRSLCWLRHVSEDGICEAHEWVVPRALPHSLPSYHPGDLHHRAGHQGPFLRVQPGGHSP